MSLLWLCVYGLLKPLTHWPPAEEGRGEERLPGLLYPWKWCKPRFFWQPSRLVPSDAAISQSFSSAAWILGPQILLFILLANRILPQQFLGRSYSEMYSQGPCPFVCSGFIGDVVEPGHNVRCVWRAPSVHSKFSLRNTHHLLLHWELPLLKVAASLCHGQVSWLLP